MKIEVELLSPELTERYDQYLLSHNNSLFYCSSRYMHFLRELLGCQHHYLLAIDGTDICGVLPILYCEGPHGRVYNSLPYYGSNGGVIAGDPDTYCQLVNAYNTIASNETTVSATIITNPIMEPDDGAADCQYKYNYTDYRIGQFTRILFQDDPWNEILGNIDASARRNVKKAIREGVEIETDYTRIESLRELHQENIRAIGGIAKTDKFFELIPEYFRPGQDFDLYIAKKDGGIIAALLIFYFNRTVEYFTPAIDSQYRSIQPLALIILTAMSDAAQRGFEWWNWGGTWLSQSGVYRFKKKWASIEKNYYYYTQLNNPSLLSWPKEQIVSTYSNFFVVPFSALNQGGTNE